MVRQGLGRDKQSRYAALWARRPEISCDALQGDVDAPGDGLAMHAYTQTASFFLRPKQGGVRQTDADMIPMHSVVADGRFSLLYPIKYHYSDRLSFSEQVWEDTSGMMFDCSRLVPPR